MNKFQVGRCVIERKTDRTTGQNFLINLNNNKTWLCLLFFFTEIFVNFNKHITDY